MNRNRVLGLIVVGSLGCAASGLAQVHSGLNELNFTGSITREKPKGGDSSTRAEFTGKYGRFLTDSIEVGPLVSVTKVSHVKATGDFGGFGAYHFGSKNSHIVPYVGGLIDKDFGFKDTLGYNPWEWGFFAGIKAFVHGGGGAVDIEPFWNRQQFHNSFHIDDIGVRAGVSIFF